MINLLFISKVRSVPPFQTYFHIFGKDENHFVSGAYFECFNLSFSCFDLRPLPVAANSWPQKLRPIRIFDRCFPFSGLNVSTQSFIHCKGALGPGLHTKQQGRLKILVFNKFTLCYLRSVQQHITHDVKSGKNKKVAHEVQTSLKRKGRLLV